MKILIGLLLGIALAYFYQNSGPHLSDVISGQLYELEENINERIRGL